MNDTPVKPPFLLSIFAYKDAGIVHNGIELALLQFKEPDLCAGDTFDMIRKGFQWNGGGGLTGFKPRPPVDSKATKAKQMHLGQNDGRTSRKGQPAPGSR